jgi:hypothetical protein
MENERNLGQEEQNEIIIESQPAWKTIEKLQGESPFERSDRHSASCTIESEGKKFTIEVIESSEDPRIDNICRMLRNTFSAAEVDPPKVTREAVDGYSKDWDTKFPKYRLIEIRRENGKLACVFTGAQLDVLNENGEPTGEAVYSVGYAATSSDVRQHGLAREAYISALIDASKEARAEGKTLKYAIGECTYTSEKFWNNVGWKRIYAKTGEKELTELEYIQPGLDFDESTGQPILIEDEDGQLKRPECPEHLMVDSFSQNPPDTKELARLHEALLHYNGDWPPSAFETPEAHQTHVAYMAGFKEKMASYLNQHSELAFLTATERESMKAEGIKIREYKKADNGDAGKEDF